MVPKVKRWADRVKGLTTGDLFEARFDRRTGTLAAVVIGIAWFTFVGGQIIAGAKLLQVTLQMNLTLAVVLAGSITLAYTMLGGLKAVIYTDVFQMFVLMIGIIFIAVPIGLIEVGGWNGIVAHFSANPETESLVQWGAVGWKRALGWFFAIFPVWFISIAALQRIVAARDERTARIGFFLTGDIGHRTLDNAILITDRKKDIIIRGGENIYPREKLAGSLLWLQTKSRPRS